MLTGLTLLAAFALLILLGSWRVRLRKTSIERPVRVDWAGLTEGAKRRLLHSAKFRDGLSAKSFPRTSQRLGDEDPPDAIFDAYLRELRRGGRSATANEWQAAMTQLKRWLASAT
jgi:hypothetical protein